MCDIFRTPLIIEHVTIHCSKYTTARHLLNNEASIKEALNQNNTENIFKFYKHIDLVNQI